MSVKLYHSYKIAYDVPMLDELYIIGCDSVLFIILVIEQFH